VRRGCQYCIIMKGKRESGVTVVDIGNRNLIDKKMDASKLIVSVITHCYSAGSWAHSTEYESRSITVWVIALHND
jgi:hypothetical protein